MSLSRAALLEMGPLLRGASGAPSGAWGWGYYRECEHPQPWGHIPHKYLQELHTGRCANLHIAVAQFA